MANGELKTVGQLLTIPDRSAKKHFRSGETSQKVLFFAKKAGNYYSSS